MNAVLEGICWYVAFLFSVTFHEAAHAWLAKLGGDLTAYHGGQVSLDPMPHIRREPIGTVVLPIISLVVMKWPFGYASAPYDPEWAASHPRRASLMALAGPVSNLILVLIAALLVKLGVHYEVFSIPARIKFTSITLSPLGGAWSGAAMLLSMLFTLNLILAILNLIPLPPLDGSGLAGLFLPAETARRYQQAMRNPALSWIGLVLAWNVFDPIFTPVFLFAVNLLYPHHGFGWA